MTMTESHSCPEHWLVCWAGTSRDLEAGVGGELMGHGLALEGLKGWEGKSEAKAKGICFKTAKGHLF